jgi:hypothetical protein
MLTILLMTASFAVGAVVGAIAMLFKVAKGLLK